MNDIIQTAVDFVIANKDWIFSGAGVALVAFLYNLFRSKRKKSGGSLSTAGHHSPIVTGSGNVTNVRTGGGENSARSA
jgi:hypothetical protein